MLPPLLEKLLILQDRDKRRRTLEADLKSIPAEEALVQNRIAREKAAIDDARTELMGLEARKKLLETEITAAEQKIGKYRTQQLEVRKNDEYQALGLEIDHTQAAIGKLEEEELGVLYAIEEAKKKFAAAEAELKANISGHENKLAALAERRGVVGAEMQTATADYEDARADTPDPSLRAYDRAILRNNPPVCVPISGGKCSGCHLKVSGDVETAARARGAGIVFCDHCGRIVWWE